MNGPDCYRKALELARRAQTYDVEHAASALAEAQVYATLAHAAATAMAAFPNADGMSAEDFRAWDEVAGVTPPRCVVCGTADGATLNRQRDLQTDEIVWLCERCHVEATSGRPADEHDDDEGGPAAADDGPEPCGENDCICYCIGDCHPCGCDCPRVPADV